MYTVFFRPSSTVHCIYGFIPPLEPGQNPCQKPSQKPGQKSGQKSGEKNCQKYVQICFQKVKKHFSQKFQPYVIGKISKNSKKVKVNGKIKW